MKRLFVAVFLFAMINLSAFARKRDGGFPLVVHITAIQVEQGQTDVYGSGRTDINGNYASSVSGGGSYIWHRYIAQIEGDNKTYGLGAPRLLYRRNYLPHIGGCQGRWNKDGTLEIQFVNAKGKPVHQPFVIVSEEITPTPTAQQTATQNAQHQACLELAKDNPSVTCK